MVWGRKFVPSCSVWFQIGPTIQFTIYSQVPTFTLILLSPMTDPSVLSPCSNRTSLDQTTLNQSVSVNGVHSDQDTSQVRRTLMFAMLESEPSESKALCVQYGFCISDSCPVLTILILKLSCCVYSVITTCSFQCPVPFLLFPSIMCVCVSVYDTCHSVWSSLTLEEY